MSISTTFADALLDHILNNADIPNIGDSGGLPGSASDGVFYFSLHTADPGTSDDQTTSECTYTSYARISLTRDGSGWTTSGSGTATPNANIEFPEATGGTETATHWGFGTDSTGTGYLLSSGSISPTIAISSGTTPRLTTSSVISIF